MEPFDLAGNFDRYFAVRIANTQALREESFRIRHEVYCEELGWEPLSDNGMETDSCDPYSVSILLEHKPSGKFAGTVRLVVPPAHQPDLPLPFEMHCASTIRKDVVDPSTIPRGHFGEISRLAVPGAFRRRAGEAKVPFVFNEFKSVESFSDAEKRNFPNIAIGLYMALTAVVTMCHHEMVFVVVEPKLCRRLSRLGLRFQQGGDELEYHGNRALFFMPAEEVSTHFSAGLLALYELVEKQVARQLILYPYQDFRAPQ